MSESEGPRPTSGRRAALLRLLQGSPAPLTITELAERMGVHPNTVRFHLDALVANGQVVHSSGTTQGPGRPPQRYAPVRRMDPTGPRHYQLLAELLVDDLATDPERRGRAIEAGRAWGRRLGAGSGVDDPLSVERSGPAVPGPAEPGSGERLERAERGGQPTPAVARLIGLLDHVGFAPELRSQAGQPAIGLRHCPFLELAEARSDIVCSVHLGLMRGAMEAWASPMAVERLEPFAEPDLCLALLSPIGAT